MLHSWRIDWSKLAGMATTQAIAWSMLQSLVPKVVSFVVFIVLARLLATNEIGVAAAIAAILAIGELIAEQGIGEALKRAHRLAFGIKEGFVRPMPGTPDLRMRIDQPGAAECGRRAQGSGIRHDLRGILR